MPRLVRRRPLSQRIKDYLDPWDWLLWASEELETSDWEAWTREYAAVIGVGLNIVFLLARASCVSSTSRLHDDVFGEYEGRVSTGWLCWFARLLGPSAADQMTNYVRILKTSFIVHLLTLFSIANTIYTFVRKRHYRLFENSINDAPSTPSAHRVRVDSSPISSSPLRFLSSMISSPTAESRAHPDPTRDVWEVAVWDPLPICLRLFCLFSPGHVLIYWIFLPVAASNPRPSVTVFTAMFLAFALSLQLSLLRSYTSQQAKDSTIIHKEVLNEYDIKFVHPNTRPQYRDVGLQFNDEADEDENTVDTYRPTTFINRGFRTNPNPNYTKFVDPDGVSKHNDEPTSRRTSFGILSPNQNLPQQTPQQVLRTPAHLRDLSSPLRPRTAVRHPLPQPSSRSSGVGLGSGSGDGGNLGIYSNARSPLRKSASTNFHSGRGHDGDSGTRDRANSPGKRPSSPLKRSSVPGPGAGSGLSNPINNPKERFGRLSQLGGRRDSDYF